MSPQSQRTLVLFGEILEYPSPRLLERVNECLPLLRRDHPEAAQLLETFSEFLAQTPLDRQEELYTITFDLQVKCYPYAGYHLFGESYKRGAFMAELNSRYRAIGFDPGNELPDHLCVLLRFLSILDDEEEAWVLLDECLVPALERMQQAFKDSENPYGLVIRGLSLVIQTIHDEMADEISAEDNRPELKPVPVNT